MSSSADSMWVTASTDFEAEAAERTQAMATVAMAEVAPFLLAAGSEAEFDTRVALQQERIDALLGAVTPDPRVHRAALDTVREDFHTLNAPRLAQRLAASRRQADNLENEQDMWGAVNEQSKADGTTKQPGDYGYIALYKGKRKEVWAPSSYQAQQRAAKLFGAKKEYEVSVHLAERPDGSPVTQTITSTLGRDAIKYHGETYLPARAAGWGLHCSSCGAKIRYDKQLFEGTLSKSKICTNCAKGMYSSMEFAAERRTAVSAPDVASMKPGDEVKWQGMTVRRTTKGDSVEFHQSGGGGFSKDLKGAQSFIDGYQSLGDATSARKTAADNKAPCPNHDGQWFDKSTGDCSCGSNHKRGASPNNPGGQKQAADTEKCWDCGGTGQVPDMGGGENGLEKCPTCGGSGRLAKTGARVTAASGGTYMARTTRDSGGFWTLLGDDSEQAKAALVNLPRNTDEPSDLFLLYNSGNGACTVFEVSDFGTTNKGSYGQFFGHPFTEQPVARSASRRSASNTKTVVPPFVREADNASPYRIQQSGDQWQVVNDDGGVKGTFDSKEQAREQQKALYSQVPGAAEKADQDKKSGSVTATYSDDLMSALREIEYNDPDGTSPTLPTEADYAAFEAWAIATFGERAWEAYRGESWEYMGEGDTRLTGSRKQASVWQPGQPCPWCDSDDVQLKATPATSPLTGVDRYQCASCGARLTPGDNNN